MDFILVAHLCDAAAAADGQSEPTRARDCRPSTNGGDTHGVAGEGRGYKNTRSAQDALQPLARPKRASQ